MKKSYLMIAAAATILAACSQTDTLKEEISDNNQKPFTFSAYADKATKASDSNKLQDFYNVFGVYGFKKVDGSYASKPVFSNTPNEYFGTNKQGSIVYDAEGEKPSIEWGESPAAGWYYEGVRYWDKNADSYEFFAIAPYESEPKYTVSAGAANFSIYTSEIKYDISKEYNLARTNLTANPVTENNAPKADLTYFGFKKDYMIAEKSAATTSDVALSFNHILAKLNVKIKKSDSYTGKQILKINKLTISKLDKQGYFVYTTNMTTKGWTSGDKARTIEISEAYPLANDNANYDGYYWIETLMFPQVVTCKSISAQKNATGLEDAYLYIEYQIGDEVYKAWYDFAHIWNNALAVNDTYEFKQGNEYTLTLTVGPEPIQFTATVNTWTPNTKNWDVDKNSPIN